MYSDMSESDKMELSKVYKLKGMLVGMCFVGMVISSGYWLSTEGESGLLQSSTPLAVSLFVGISTGHFFGKAIIDDGEIKQYVAFGAFLTLTGYWLYYAQISPLTLTMVLATGTLILSHDTAFIENHEQIQMLTEAFAEDVSVVGLLIIGFFRVLVPEIPTTATVTIASETVPVLGLVAGVILIAVLIPFMLAFYEKMMEVMNVSQQRRR